MYWLTYSLLATTLWAAYWQNAVVGEESSNKTEESTLAADPKENEIFLQPLVPEPASTGLAENRTGESNAVNVTTSDEVSLKTGPKRDAEDITFNDIKPFLLFPILPFLFPPKEEENLNSGKDEFSTPKNDTAKIDGNPIDAKPFIFFDFAFNIRQIPLINETEKLNGSKVINVTKLSVNDADDTKMDSTKSRRRRYTKIETPGFFDDVPLFPDSELDEFLPKPDLFFPDLPFHHKPAKKLSRRKRDQKTTELKNDLKSFFDAFDEAFMRTKRELEWTNPILNFLRGGDPFFDEEKKEADDFFSQIPDTQEKPSVKWRIQRNIKRLNNDRQPGLIKVHDSPTIIFDKVVKIDEMNSNSDQDISKSIFELTKQEGTKRKKRVHVKIVNPDEEIPKEAESKEQKNSPEANDSFHSASVKRSAELDKRGNDVSSTNTNSTEDLYNLMKAFDSLKGKMESELKNSPNQSYGNKKKNEAHNEMRDSLIHQELKKNLTELLKQFMALNKNLNEPKLDKNIPLGERENSRLADWTEKETLQNTNILGKGSRERRQKSNAYFEGEYVNQDKKDTKSPDINNLLLHVTIPTVIVFGIIFLICFFSLQAKGKICTSLFKPRQVLIVNDEAATQLKSSGTRKIQAI